MSTKQIIWTAAIAMVCCVVIDYVLPLKANGEKLTRI